MAGFLAYLSADVEGDEVLYIPFDIEMYDYDNNYNTSNGVYTGNYNTSNVTQVIAIN